MTVNLVILGVLLGIIFYEITDISPGGIIVPGLLAMYYRQVDRIIYTLVIALIAYFIVKLLSRYFVIFGKRRFVLMIIISIFLNVVLDLILHSFSLNMLNLTIIGYTIAGIIANDFYKQGLVKTVPALVIVTGLTILIGLLCSQWGLF
ncbi:MAG: poly-gamma-glutamate biosynthesis protein PgsC [Bacilli bacterium]|nr:poly-gamma-glutamate biosynthesis protein PgsC [Bacilli bacterium]